MIPMKKNVFLLSIIVLFSCDKEDMYNKGLINGKLLQISERKFIVEKDDIEKIISDFFYQPINTRSHDDACKIVAIDSIKADHITTKSNSAVNVPHNLLYFVKLADGSTMIVGGDKRAEPLYAHFENLDLRINDEGELVGQDSIPDMVVYLIENYIVDIKNKTKDNDQLNSYYNNNQDIETRSGNSNIDEIQPKLAYRFTDAYKYNKKSDNYNIFVSQNIKPWTIHALCVAIPDNVEIRSFDKYTLKASWKKAKKLDVAQLQGDMYQVFVAMSNKIPDFSFMPNSILSGNIAFSFIKNFFSGADGTPSLSYDTDWYNMLNNLRLKTGIS